MSIRIGSHKLGINSPTYFVADIAASHDGQLSRAIDLIGLAAEAGADAAKFQNFKAKDIVSDRGFSDLGSGVSHQSKWKKSVTEVYREASIPEDWTPVLDKVCKEVGIDYFSSPYDFASVDLLAPYVPAFKIGSGDITWLEELEYIAKKGKPVLLATGASTIGEVADAMEVISKYTSDIVLMQCNTNYTASLDNFRYINLNVLKTYAEMFPEVTLGLSDHTPGHATVLGAIALGARCIEKHFTDDTSREGPDHAFSMDPKSWKEMVDRSRELELALGSPWKRVEENEEETVIIQRRAIRTSRNLDKETVIQRDDLSIVRPAVKGSIPLSEINNVVGRKLAVDMDADIPLRWENLK